MSRLPIAQRFLRFYRQADTIYTIHSPFVYELAHAILEDDRHFYAFSMIEPIRQMHLQNHHSIKVQDFGAGSLVNKGAERKVSAIAKSALSSPYRSRLLFRIVNYLKPKTMLELGTSLGISALYQASASLDARLITLEGSAEIAKLAKTSFKAYEPPVNIDVEVGPFEKTLTNSLQELKTLDYAFLDGNHRKTPTIKYFEKCLAHAHEGTVLVFDDIYWSEGMYEAWEAIKKHPSVRLSVDLFYVGLIFFRAEQKNTEHFKIVPSHWKPWSMGFFSS